MGDGKQKQKKRLNAMFFFFKKKKNFNYRLLKNFKVFTATFRGIINFKILNLKNIRQTKPTRSFLVF